ncbi:hypothetical protein CFOL_v3_35570 [Cephalotus follicularis]|uniref:Uncharacterized protein n=1 Tax=Cephalotus follicularis TaxID=3775 RepID=A0A1Q3DIE9_CEPFO|nr:hypothetical protein CFOL_v3_35570 [Cephalotus follicularis]
MLDGLCEQYHDTIKIIGLGGLLSITWSPIKRRLCAWLVPIFYCQTSSFMLGDSNVTVTPTDIENVWRLNNVGEPMQFHDDGEEHTRLCELFNVPNIPTIKLKHLEERLKVAAPGTYAFKA